MESRFSLSHCLLLIAVTLACLLPFAAKPFHVDDPLFVWSAQQIAQHPSNPYGFNVVWYETAMPMAAVTKNPPLACYYGALIGLLAGWSERAWHLGFLLPTLAFVLGTYRLAGHFTRFPLIASLAALLTPGILVSSSGVMCDVMMVSFWVWATVSWIEGLQPTNRPYLALSGFLIAASALTKYFGAALIPLLFLYSLIRTRRLGSWAWYLLIPATLLAGYQFWTHALYGHGLLWDAAQYAHFHQTPGAASVWGRMLTGTAFLGGCALTGLTLAPLLWSRKTIASAGIACGSLGFLIRFGSLDFGVPEAHEHWNVVSAHFVLFLAAGFSVLALALNDFRRAKDANSIFLSLWVLGTFIFASLLDWTISARSLLPLIPAAAILLARQIENREAGFGRISVRGLVLGLAASGLISVWVVAADTELANSARKAANYVIQAPGQPAAGVLFEGHWGFQYYMQVAGARPLDQRKSSVRAGDLLVVPENNSNTFALSISPELQASEAMLSVPLRTCVSTISRERGAGFYSSLWGPLPFAFGPVAPERYHLFRFTPPISR